MDRLTSRTPQDAPETARTVLTGLVQFSPTGKPLNLHAQMANSPALLHAYVSLRRALDEHATLEPRVRVALMLAAATSMPGTNAYVRAVTSSLAARAGWSPDQIAALRTGQNVSDERMGALLQVVRHAAADHGHVDDEVWSGARAEGWTEQQLAEAYAYVALTVFTGDFLNFAKTPLDLPAGVPEGAGAR